MNYLREGETLIVTRIDRLARSLRDLQNIVYDLKSEGVELQATEQPIDTNSAAGKAFLEMLGVFAEFEGSIRKERQLEGIAKAKEKGVYKGRKPTALAKSLRIKEMSGSRYFCESLFWASQPQASDKNLTATATAFGAPIRPRHPCPDPTRGRNIGSK
ncbi:hypothetical protein BPLS_P0405 [Bathymodiolus platifrons methanotrophic gill symbiont]|nr:hypothetical protein BPLS_P0405 [Bathymodiolus platifrons methanotrophic gill symbiont]